MRKAIDITGQKFGRLTAVRFIEVRKNSYFWLFKCDCGKDVMTQKGNVVSGLSKSCGCWKIQRLTKHGMTKTRFYNIWGHILSRCHNSNVERFKNYGGRGIKVCKRWLTFINFKDDMYESYREHLTKFGKKNTTIDRIDTNGNYCESNCRWATYKEQNNNKRNNRLLTHNGKTQCVLDWAKELKISPSILYKRITQRKWTIKQALTTPVK